MENVEIPMGACSGCAGNYEDPDRTAWEPEAEEDEGDGAGVELPEPEVGVEPGEESGEGRHGEEG